MPSPASFSLKLVRRTGRALRHAKQAIRRSSPLRRVPRSRKVEFVDAAGNVTVKVVREPPPADSSIRRLVSWYGQALVSQPIRTNAVTQGVLCGLGDGIAQACEWKLDVMSPGKSEYNYMRTARMAAYGFLVAGPIYCMWYRLLDRVGRSVRVSYQPLVTGRLGSLLQSASAFAPHSTGWIKRLRTSKPAPVSAAQLTAGKVLADAILGNPMILHAYFASIGLLEGRPLSDIVSNTKEKFHNAWGLAVIVWTPIQCVNFGLVPLHLQAAFVAVANVGWSTTLSLLSHYKEFGSAEQRAALQRRNSSSGETISRLQNRVRELQLENATLREALLDSEH